MTTLHQQDTKARLFNLVALSSSTSLNYLKTWALRSDLNIPSQKSDCVGQNQPASPYRPQEAQ